MDLILWRHAQAEDGTPDADRALTAEGHRQARAMAHWLTPQLPKRLHMVVSPTRRTQETARALERRFETNEMVAPGATTQTLLRAADWPSAKEATMIVGHQPTLGNLACYLLTGADASWSVRKGAVWWFRGRQREQKLEAVLRLVIAPEWLL